MIYWASPGPFSTARSDPHYHQVLGIAPKNPKVWLPKRKDLPALTIFISDCYLSGGMLRLVICVKER